MSTHRTLNMAIYMCEYSVYAVTCLLVHRRSWSCVMMATKMGKSLSQNLRRGLVNYANNLNKLHALGVSPVTVIW